MLGLFRLSSLAFNGRLHILCYHGFQVRDECRFRPMLFISRETFAARLNHIRSAGFVVLPLGAAIDRLKAGTLPKRAVAITIDDGFASTFSVAAPLLHEFGFPATVYVTTYYVEKGTPVFRLAMQYVFWKAGAPPLTRLAALAQSKGWPKPAAAATADEYMWALIEHGEALGSEPERQAMIADVATTLGIDARTITAERLVSLLSPEELRTLAAQGFDIQLHTHTHRFPRDDDARARAEIQENRSRLESLTGRQALHFCYPSGIYSTSQWPLLNALGVSSATTCLSGSNTPTTPLYELRRFLDSEDVRPIEFRAELAGINEFLRMLKGRRGTAAPARADIA